MRIYKGLTEEEVDSNRKKYGTNKIEGNSNNSFLSKLIESMSDPIIKILIIALAIKVIFTLRHFDWYETIGIVISIFVASFISTVSEYGSEKAFKRLQEEASKTKCKVRRNNETKEISVDDIVIDDIVLLESGDKIPSDGVIIDGSIGVDESSLTGEAKEVYKNERDNVFKGTTVYSNHAVMRVTKIGKDTMYGKLALELTSKQPDGPLKQRLAELAKVISKIGYVCSFLVSISYLFSTIVIKNNFEANAIIDTVSNIPLMIGHILYALTLCVTIIIVAVPEGLPVMITLVLSSNMKRMVKDNVLVRKMTGIETAGNLNILYTDKTGTLTKGKLEVIGFINGQGKEYTNEYELHKDKKIYDLVKESIIYNNEAVKQNGKIIGGNITDRALLDFIKTEYTLENIKKNIVTFNSKNKYSSVDINNKKLIKGAPEVIIKHCTYCYTSFGDKRNFVTKEDVIHKIEQFTSKGIRVIAFAIDDNFVKEKNFKNLTFLGFMLIKDEIRKEAIDGIKLVQSAGIKTVMITGDNKNTAISIGKETGILKEDGIVLTSDEMNNMSDEKLKEIIPNLQILARALPQDKSRLVKISQDLDLVVGMTGDGVNDAPSLKKADVGFAMGSGTEVAKEASDIIILDDNFKSISKAILYGRTIFKSIRKFIILQLTINMCAMVLSLIGPFIGVETPVTVIQMLWINMVMDTLAGVAFAFEPPLLEYMKEKPKKRNEPIINKYMLNQIIFTGLYSSILCIIFLKSHITKKLFNFESGNTTILTAFFCLFIFIDIFNSLNARTNRINILSNILKNKVFLGIISFITAVQLILIYFGGETFRTSGLSFFQLQITILLAMTVIPFDWFRKYILKIKNQNTGV